MQHTLQTSVSLQGTGLHTGATISMTLRPAAADTGIVFMRTDRPAQERVIPALWNRVVDTRLCTVIGNEHCARMGTV